MAAARPNTLGTLEIGRFLAASIVLLTHLCGDVARYGSGAGAKFFAAINLPTPLAVSYFFVLSGFVMMTAHHGDFGSLKAVPRFWWRRACRIFPVYWLALGLMVYYLYAALTPHLAVLMVSLAPVPVVEFVSPAWSLRFEIAFYLVFGLCLLPYIGRVLLGLWVCAVLWLWRPAALSSFLLCAPTKFLQSESVHFPLFFAPFEIFFFAGLAAAIIRLPGTRTGFAAIAAGVLLLLAAGPYYQWGSTYGAPLTPVFTGAGLGLVILGLATLERHGALRLGRWARRLGAMSYPLYILHIPLMVYADGWCWNRPHPQGAALFIFAALYLATLYLICAGATWLFDQPLQRTLRRIGEFRKRPGLHPGPAGA